MKKEDLENLIVTVCTEDKRSEDSWQAVYRICVVE